MVNNASLLAIDPDAFNSATVIEARVASAHGTSQGALRTALTYLYSDDGPINLPRARMMSAEQYLDSAERIIIRWLYTRTNGSLRKTYGAEALRAARTSRYRCEACGFADVRVLNIDHVDGRIAETTFACLCANCHAIKSRKFDWSGAKGGSMTPNAKGGAQPRNVEAERTALPPQHCPICNATVASSERYPNYVCQTCVIKASTLDGRLLVFGNIGVSGGFIARFKDTGAESMSHECYIQGVRCRANEAYFGGIVIQPEELPRR